MNEIQESIFQTMNLFTDMSQQSSTSSKTIQAIITTKISPSSYIVNYQGALLNVMASTEYNKDDNVYILLPRGDINAEGIIIGKVKKTFDSENIDDGSRGSSYYDVSKDLVKFYEPDDKSRGIAIDTGEDGEIEIDNLLSNIGVYFNRYFTDYPTMKFQFKILTNFIAERRKNGKYSIILRIPIKKIESPQYIAKVIKDDQFVNVNSKEYKEVVITSEDIMGNPYGFNTQSTQTVYFTIDNEKYTYDVDDMNIKLYIHWEDFDSVGSNTDDILLSDFELTFVKKVDLNQDYILDINPGIEGPYFDSRFSSTKKTLTAEMFQNGNKINLLGFNPEDLQIKLFGEDETNTNNRWFIYWFKEDVTIDASSEDGYSSYGGDGWRCLNDVIFKDVNPGSQDMPKENIYEEGILAVATQKKVYCNSKPEITIKQKDVSATTDYKCVVIYKENGVDTVKAEKVVTIYNFDKNNNFTLQNANGSSTVYIKNKGEVKLKAIFEWFNLSAGDINFKWYRYDKDNKKIKDAEPFYKENVKIEDNQAISTISFKVSKIDTKNTILCQVYKDKQQIDSRKIVLTTTEYADSAIVVTGGDQVFKYTKKGELEKATLPEVSFAIRKEDGTEITDDEYRKISWKWYIPKQSLYTINKIAGVSPSKEESDSNYDCFIINGNKEGLKLQYKIAKNFNWSKSKLSDIIIRANYKNYNLEETVSNLFLKDGMSNMGGKGYSADIVAKVPSGFCDDNSYGEIINGVPRKVKILYKNNTFYYYSYKENDERYIAKKIGENTLIQFKTNVFYDGEDKASITYNYSILNNSSTTIFDIVKDENSDYYNLVIKEKANEVMNKLYKSLKEEDIPPSILQVKVTIKNSETLYCYYPIELTLVNDNFPIKDEFINTPILGGGFSEVIYGIDGSNPYWDKANKFSCEDRLIFPGQIGEAFNIDWQVSDNLIIKGSKDIEKTIEPTEKFKNKKCKNYVMTHFSFDSKKNQELINEKDKQLSDINEIIAYLSNRVPNLTEKPDEQYTDFYSYGAALTFDTWKSGVKKYKGYLKNKKDLCGSLEELLLKINENAFQEISIKKISNNQYNSLAQVIEIQQNLEKIKTQTEDNLDKARNNNFALSSYDIPKKINNVIDEAESLIFIYDDITSLMVKINNEYLTDEKIKEKFKQSENFIKYFDNIKDIIMKAPKKYTAKNGMIFNYSDLNFDVVLNNSYEFLDKMKVSYTCDEIRKYFSNMYSIIFKEYFENIVISSNGVFVSEPILVPSQKIINYLENAVMIKHTEYKSIYSEKVTLETFNNGNKETKYHIIHINPVVIYYDTDVAGGNFEEWDGQNIQLEDGSVLAPQIGAGGKDSEGKFTGVLIGSRQLSDGNTQTGLFGYNKSNQTFSFNAENGYGVIGGWNFDSNSISSTVKLNTKSFIEDGLFSFNEQQKSFNTTNIKSSNATEKRIVLSAYGGYISAPEWSISADGTATFNHLILTKYNESKGMYEKILDTKADKLNIKDITINDKTYKVLVLGE